MDDYYLVEEEASDEEEVASISSEEDDFKSMFSEKMENEEDFEAEMERERQTKLQAILGSPLKSKQKAEEEQKHLLKVKDKEKEEEEAGDEYEDDEDDNHSVNSNSNDALFYDPKADDNDQKWVDKKRATEFAAGKNPSTCDPLVMQPTGSQRKVKSDATLNCPGCMTMLCLDSQRHDVYKTQYRAMFVFNCTVDFKEKLVYKDKQPKGGRRRQAHFKGSAGDEFFPVKCTVCETQIAVYDLEEVYHFFNVLASFT